MAVSKAQKQALKKYSQSKKGQEALQRAHQKRVKTDEYRAYQRQKQAEYRRKAKEPTKRTETARHQKTQTQPDPLPAASLPELDQLIERFEADLHNCIQHEGLSPESLPLAYRTILDALNRWQAKRSRGQKAKEG